jgi:hypothetical protein
MDAEHFEPRRSPDAPLDAFGVHWTCWQNGSGLPKRWISDDKRLVAGRASEGRTFRAAVDGETLLSATGQPRRFLSLTSAMEAAVEGSQARL